MITACLSFILLLAPEDIDETEALQITFQAALAKIDASVVTIETVGGIRQINIPENLKKKMTMPERPREGDRNAPEDDGEEDVPPEGRTPRFKDEWRKMLAMPGFQKAEGPTTGVVLTADGYILTSAWNFEGKPNVVTVTTSDRKTRAARLLGVDRAAGLALVKVDMEGLTPATFVDPDNVKMGAWALAVGRVLSLDVDVKYGVISARNRIEGNALQTDAATSPSNYGGPLVDIEGRVYGIIVPLGARGEEANPNWYDSGIAFAAPVRDVAALVKRLGKEGVKLWPAFLGVSTNQERTEAGALVMEVTPEQAAQKAGIQKGDIILAIDGAEIRNPFSLRFEVGRRRADDVVKLKVKRKDETLEVEAKLGRRPKPKRNREKIPVPMPGGKKKNPKRGKEG